MVKLHTPAIKNKNQIDIEVMDDERNAIIFATITNQTIDEKNTEIKNDLPDKFKFDVEFPNRINVDIPVHVEIEDGVSLLKFSIQNKKRKIQVV